MADFFDYYTPYRHRAPYYRDRHYQDSGDLPQLDKEDIGGLTAGQIRALSLLNALPEIEQGGMVRSASPMGAIARGVSPIIQALLNAKAYQASAAAQAQAGALKDLKTAAEIEHLGSLAGAESALAEERRGKGEYRKKQQEMIDKLLSGADGQGATRGMKPKITYGPSGPSVTYSSDVLSPEALQQRIDIQRAGSATTLGREKELARFKATELPAKMTNQDRQTVEAGKTLLGLLGDAEKNIASLPADMTPRQLASNMRNYQIRSQHPLVVNTLKSVTGMGFPSDESTDAYASWVGQVQAALGSFNVQGQRGGYQLLQYLKDHFPNYADSPAEAQRKAQLLRKDTAVIQRRIDAIMGELTNAASLADDHGGEASQGWLRKQVRNKKTGQVQDIWLNPATGETSAEDPNAEQLQAP